MNTTAEFPPVPCAAPQARGMLRGLLLIAGWVSLLLGVIGIILPLLPTAPFLLLAVACFSRSSESMVRRMYALPMVGRYLRDWQEEGISPGMKWSALAALWVTTLAGVVFIAKTVLVKTAMLVMAILVSIHFLLMPVRRRRSRAPTE